MKQMVVLLLSGATIPLAFFPDTLRTVVSFLPFQSIYNAPLSLLLNGSPDVQTVLRTLGQQLFWAVAMTLLSAAFWNRSLRQITVNGG